MSDPHVAARLAAEHPTIALQSSPRLITADDGTLPDWRVFLITAFLMAVIGPFIDRFVFGWEWDQAITLSIGIALAFVGFSFWIRHIDRSSQ